MLPDLEFWYGNGPGNPVSAALGIGYVQELVARLTQTPIDDFSTAINRTLDENNVTFPLNQPIYVDATHDTALTTGEFLFVSYRIGLHPDDTAQCLWRSTSPQWRQTAHYQ